MNWLHVTATLALLWPAGSGFLLPTNLRPQHYELTLAVDINADHQFPFYGAVQIWFKVAKPTNKIVLHSKDHKIAQDKIKIEGPQSPKVLEIEQGDNTTDFLNINLDDHLTQNGVYQLIIPFSGNLKEQLKGAYISSYVDLATNKTEYLVSTQFEAISARNAFPCFDEPNMKATFSIRLGHSKEFTAISNMPLSNSTTDNLLGKYWSWETMAESFKIDKNNYMWDMFQKSVPMSTYLVAFVISKFLYMESPKHLSNATFKIWARKDALDQTSYASTIGPKILTFYEKWFNVPFPLPKQDMIAIPDFGAGAMENWGLITYRETALLYDKDETSLQMKERVAEVIAHELAHQWFGNLVTMKWWQDLWLNEGFATYVADIGMREINPEWKSEMTGAVSNMRSVLTLDALQSSHPISIPIDDPRRIDEIFDEISYKKGALLIRMMVMFLGEDVFTKAINHYLVKHSYSNAAQDDLWAELTIEAQKHNVLSRNVTIKEIMDTWTTQTGYPLLTIKRDYDDRSLTITQKRFLSLGAQSETDVSWWVPLKVLCERDENSGKVQWLSNSEGTKLEYRFQHSARKDEWVLFNSDMLALTRVNYDDRNWNLLIKTLNSESFQKIPPLSRVQLLSDAFAFVWTNELGIGTILNLAKYLQRETELTPLETGIGALRKFDNILKRDPDYGIFQRYVRNLIEPAYRRSGGLNTKKIMRSDDLLSVKMQVMTSREACYMKVPECEDNAVDMFKQWMESDNPDEHNPIPLDLRRIVYCVAVSRGSVTEWEFLLARARRSNVAAAKIILLAGMACTRDVWLLKRYLELSINGTSVVRRQDTSTIISAIMQTQVGFYFAKEFVLERTDDLYKAFGGNSRPLGLVLKRMLEEFTTENELEEFMEWRKDNEKYVEDNKLAVGQGLEKARINIGWLNKHKAEFIQKISEIAL